MENKNLGKRGTDSITGFEGTVIGFCQYLTGCDQYLLTPKTDDPSKKPDGHWFDSSRLSFSPGKVVSINIEKGKEGCDLPAPTK